MIFYNKQKKKTVKTDLFEFCFWLEPYYIRIHSTPILTYLTSSLQTSLQNQTKREANRKMTSLRSGI